VANTKMFAPIARAGVKDEPRIDFDNIIINGSVRYFGLVKQRQGGEALGRGHLVPADSCRFTNAYVYTFIFIGLEAISWVREGE
jgi:hypothetical protein